MKKKLEKKEVCRKWKKSFYAMNCIAQTQVSMQANLVTWFLIKYYRQKRAVTIPENVNKEMQIEEDYWYLLHL